MQRKYYVFTNTHIRVDEVEESCVDQRQKLSLSLSVTVSTLLKQNLREPAWRRAP